MSRSSDSSFFSIAGRPLTPQHGLHSFAPPAVGRAQTRLQDARLSDPRLSDPRLSDPRLSDPRLSDPRLDPRLSDPRLDPRLSDPRLSDPRLDPARLALSEHSASRSSEAPGGLGLFDAPATRGRGRGRGRGRASVAAEPENGSSLDIRVDGEGASRGRGRGRGRNCRGGWGQHDDDDDNPCPYEMSRRMPRNGLPHFHNLLLQQIPEEEFAFSEFSTMVDRESAQMSRLGYKVDMSFIMEQSEEDLERVVQLVFESLTVRCRSQDPRAMIHEVYDIWCNTFFAATEEGMRQDAAFPKSPNEIIVRSFACIDGYKIIYTRLYQYYEQRRMHTTPEKQMILRRCHELVARMHLICRAFCCLAQATTIGFDSTVSVERVAHEYSMRVPFLTGLELPIDYNVPGRQSMGTYDPVRESYQYLLRYVLAMIEQNKYKIHGSLLYVQHVLPDERAPSGFVQTRFWKPFMDLTKFIYQGIMPTYHEHVFRAIISIREMGVKQMVEQIVNSNFVQRIHPNYRFRSFRNGLYQIEVDLNQEPDLAWNDPARLNGRFIPYSSPACPMDVASETFFDTDFDPLWVTQPVQDIDTFFLDTLLSTQNIKLDHFMRRPADIAELAELEEEPPMPEGPHAAEALERMRYISRIVGDLMPLGQQRMDWRYDMGFVYAMALFMCGRCLRPLQTKVFDHTGERYQMNDNYQCAPFFVGNPGTGKSTLLNLLTRMYHRTSVHELKCNSDAQFGLGPLMDDNIKFVYMSETSRQMPWSVSVLNTMVEGQNTELRVMRKDPVVKLTTFTMAFAANPDQVPIEWIKDPRQGFRRRLAVFQFMIPPEKSDSELITKLMREDELAKMLVKFNRMYLLGRAYFDALRMGQGSFNFMQYITNHLYFTRVRSELFALASPADSFLQGDNEEFLELDSSSTKAFLLQDVMKALRDFCAQRQVPVQRVPSQQAMVLTLQSSNCRVVEGTLNEEEEALMPKDPDQRQRAAKKKYTFVYGLVLKNGARGYHPIDVQQNRGASSSIAYENGRNKRARVDSASLRPSQMRANAMTTVEDQTQATSALHTLAEEWDQIERE